MKVNYSWRKITLEQRVIHEYLLLNEIEKQKWFHIVYLKLWKSVGLICNQ